MYHFKATLDIIGINPFVFIPEEILKSIFLDAKKDKGPVPVSGKINGKPFRQTLVKYAGHWRLYINTTMVSKSPKRIGEQMDIEIAYDAADRSILPPAEFINALDKNPSARKVFESLNPSLQKEIVRYLTNLKTSESMLKNIEKAILFLNGEARFVGRMLNKK
jgi:Bacteriocin-protection, YdeI or OmpD-Associated/Domain of unknown function (DUF1905)